MCWIVGCIFDKYLLVGYEFRADGIPLQMLPPQIITYKFVFRKKIRCGLCGLIDDYGRCASFPKKSRSCLRDHSGH